MRLKYNSPVILTFTLLSTFIYLLSIYASGLSSFLSFILPGDTLFDRDAVNAYFIVPGSIGNAGIKQYFTIVTHILGHNSWEHLLSNFSLILLLGPILEEKYGSKKLLLMIVCTAAFTGILNILLFETGLLGASGIVFMLILLSSITNYKSGDLPITFVLVVILYLGKEIVGIFEDDQISQFAHILGGISGAIFGFVLNRTQENKEIETEKEVKKDSRGKKPVAKLPSELEPIEYLPKEDKKGEQEDY